MSYPNQPLLESMDVEQNWLKKKYFTSSDPHHDISKQPR